MLSWRTNRLTLFWVYFCTNIVLTNKYTTCLHLWFVWSHLSAVPGCFFCDNRAQLLPETAMFLIIILWGKCLKLILIIMLILLTPFFFLFLSKTNLFWIFLFLYSVFLFCFVSSFPHTLFCLSTCVCRPISLVMPARYWRRMGHLSSAMAQQTSLPPQKIGIKLKHSQHFKRF